MEKQTIVTIILTLITFIIIILVGILALNKTQSQLFEFCADKEWEGTHEITGDFSGEIDCKAMWEDNFADGKWAKNCSEFPFTTKPSCKWLCAQDCKMINEQAKENKQGEIYRCVC